MSETSQRKITRRSQAHADVADSAPFRQRIETLTESEFGRALVAEARARGGSLTVRNFAEEWLKSDDGLIYEITAEVAPAEE